MLMDLGFSEHTVRCSLVQTRWNENRAVNLLLTGEVDESLVDGGDEPGAASLAPDPKQPGLESKQNPVPFVFDPMAGQSREEDDRKVAERLAREMEQEEQRRKTAAIEDEALARPLMIFFWLFFSFRVAGILLEEQLAGSERLPLAGRNMLLLPEDEKKTEKFSCLICLSDDLAIGEIVVLDWFGCGEYF